MECGALLDVFGRLPDTDASRVREPKERIRRIVAMLTRLGAGPITEP